MEDTKVLNSFKIQPVMPIPILDQKWNLIFRPVFNILSVPLDKDVGRLFGASQNQIVSNPGLASIAGDPFGRTSGLGDSVLLTLLGPNRDIRLAATEAGIADPDSVGLVYLPERRPLLQELLMPFARSSASEYLPSGLAELLEMLATYAPLDAGVYALSSAIFQVR